MNEFEVSLLNKYKNETNGKNYRVSSNILLDAIENVRVNDMKIWCNKVESLHSEKLTNSNRATPAFV